MDTITTDLYEASGTLGDLRKRIGDLMAHVTAEAQDAPAIDVPTLTNIVRHLDHAVGYLDKAEQQLIHARQHTY